MEHTNESQGYPDFASLHFFWDYLCLLRNLIPAAKLWLAP